MTQFKEWFSIPIPRPMADTRIYCFPYAGGSAASFRSWVNKFPENFEVAILQLPGRDNRFGEKFLTNMDDVITAVIDVLQIQHSGAPGMFSNYYFFGHSVGALMAYELCHRMQSYSFELPKTLFVSGKRAPHVPLNRELLHELDPITLKNKLIELDGTPQIVLDTPELFDLFIPRLRADFQINETYVFQKNGLTLDCPIQVFGGYQDKETTIESLNAWSDHTSSKFSIRMFEGGHFFLHKHEDQLIEMLVSAINTDSFVAA